MECPTRDELVPSCLRSQAEQADAESAVRKTSDALARKRILEAARQQLLARRKELLDHRDRRRLLASYRSSSFTQTGSACN